MYKLQVQEKAFLHTRWRGVVKQSCTYFWRYIELQCQLQFPASSPQDAMCIRTGVDVFEKNELVVPTGNTTTIYGLPTGGLITVLTELFLRVLRSDNIADSTKCAVRVTQAVCAETRIWQYLATRTVAVVPSLCPRFAYRFAPF